MLHPVQVCRLTNLWVTVLRFGCPQMPCGSDDGFQSLGDAMLQVPFVTSMFKSFIQALIFSVVWGECSGPEIQNVNRVQNTQ
ncbi:hypothetical protein TNIN_332911 [Trichonephila inaurata madagascariensis]|uniref:Uncharacterized protein n=1 Tax=Trichonephila inaurata madagascariensis TaxID=2747483 RepID=A0A8X6JQA4_9ARAC|nr:hypothetical protein TNIN_332911 [Trichonephila inaurata madagascariensis]